MEIDSFQQLKDEIDKRTSIEEEPEIMLNIQGQDYMIIGYQTKCSFQRCGHAKGSGEYFYVDLDTLYHTNTVDNICLKNIWSEIESVYFYQSC